MQVPGNKEIREILAKRIDRHKQSVGIAVGVIDPDGPRVVAYGKLANGDPRQSTADTIFEIGSVTKLFTSLLLADMVNRREVSLDDPAAKYLPENVGMPERSGRPITLLDLSTHYSGLPNIPGNPGVDDLYQFLSSQKLPADPAPEYEYSNLGAGLLGQLLANRAGTDYESLVRSRLTQPLNMPDTGITPSSLRKQRAATGHNAMLEPVASLDLFTLAPAGAIRSSANDMLTFLETFLGYRDAPLASAMRAMLEVRRPAGKMDIGLGWLRFGDTIGHNGRTGGFCSFVGCDLKARTGVVVLSNASTAVGVDDIGSHLLNPNLPLASPEPPNQRVAIQMNPELLDQYTGRYQVTPNLIFEITRDGDCIFAGGFTQLPHNQSGVLTALPKFELFAESERNFFARVADNQITFETGPEGRTRSLILHKAGRDIPAPRMS